MRGENVKLARISYEQKSVLRSLMELYQYDMSPYEDDSDNDVNEYGLYDYKYVDHYWTEEGRHPYFVKVSGKLAGFVLVREIEASDLSAPGYSLAEFLFLRNTASRVSANRRHSKYSNGSGGSGASPGWKKSAGAKLLDNDHLGI